MINVEHTVNEHGDNRLLIIVDLNKEFGPSKSGKTIVVASTKGNKRLEGTDCFLGLNVYKYPEEKEE